MAHGYRYPYLVWLGNRAWNTADRGTDYSVFLFDNSTDDPGKNAWMSDISTEPDDGNYVRQTVSYGGFDVDRYNTEIGVLLGDVSFDITDTTGYVDSFGIVASLEYFENMGREDQYTAGNMVDIFVGSGPLGEPRDLGEYSGSWSIETGVSLASMY